MKNKLVARILYEIADLLDLDGVPFKPRAYRRAAQTVESLTTPIEEIVAEGRISALPGVGEAIGKKIAEIVETGKLKYHEDLKKKLPVDLHSLTAVDGIGPKTARLLYEQLGIKTLADLERAARAGRIRGVKGLGEKTEEKILHGIGEARRMERRVRLGEALPLARDLCSKLLQTGLFDHVQPAGSLRRGRETVGDLDLLAIANDPEEAAAAFVSLPDVDEVLARGTKKASVRLAGGMQVDLRIVPKSSFGAALQYFTGSKAHNIALRKRAVGRGWKLNEYGLFNEKGNPIAGRTEEEIYERLGLLYIPPELREDRGEIERAASGNLPSLLSSEEIRGDLHVHTTWSDGKATLADMVTAAQKRGLSYIAITDHARFSEAIGGVSPDDLARQLDEIAETNDRLNGFKVLSGVEANVLRDGSLDVPDALLKRLDIATAAVHSHFHLTRKEMTARLIRAVENPLVDILAHPTGRKIGERPAYDADWNDVFHHAAKAKTAMEINANPTRLDLNADLIRRALDAGVFLTIGTDAHAIEHLQFMEYGVITARRGWAEGDRVLNTYPAKRLLEWLRSG